MNTREGLGQGARFGDLGRRVLGETQKEEAREKLPHPLGEWLEVPAQYRVIPEHGAEYEVVDYPQRRDDEFERFEVNNGMVVFVDSDGQTFVAPVTSEAVRFLEEAGYRRGATVPFSNGEKPADPQMRSRLEALHAAASEQGEDQGE